MVSMFKYLRDLSELKKNNIKSRATSCAKKGRIVGNQKVSAE